MIYISSVLIDFIMFVRIKKSGANSYLQIVQSYREGPKVKQRVIGTLGRLEEVAGSRDIDSLINKLAPYSKEAVMVLYSTPKIRTTG